MGKINLQCKRSFHIHSNELKVALLIDWKSTDPNLHIGNEANKCTFV